jgi:uridine kinase
MLKFTDESKLWERITELFPDGAILAISGYGGAGKTELGKKLGRDKQGIQLIHVDDYLDWPKICERNDDGSGVDFESILTAHIEPFRAVKKPVDYLIIEGIQLFSSSRQKHFDFRVWIDTPVEKANNDGQARDKQNQKLWDEVWIPNELAFEKKYDPKQYADAFYSWID